LVAPNLIPLLSSTKPFKQNDWPNPQVAKQPYRNDTRGMPVTLLLNGNPGRPQSEWPNPRLAPQPDRTRDSQSSPLALLSGPISKPFSQTHWPNPQQVKVAFQDGNDPMPLTLLQVGAPFAQRDWPLPKIAPRGSGDSRGMPQTLLNVGAPFHQTDWPNPRGPVPLNVGTSAVGMPTTLLNVGKPFAQTDWPLAIAAKWPDLGLSYNSPIVLTQTVAGTPLRPFDWPNPRQPAFADVSFIVTPYPDNIPPAIIPPVIVAPPDTSGTGGYLTRRDLQIIQIRRDDEDLIKILSKMFGVD
jgi:hypothetical protein